MSRGRASTSVDVAVIGGGIIGTAAALELARGGASVALFEATAIGAGASGRNSGSVQFPFDDVLATLHEESVERYRRLGLESGGSFAFPERPAGLLLLAPEADSVVLEAEAAALPASGSALAPAFITGADLKRLEPSLAPDLAALRLETGYPVPPAAAVEGFARLAAESGVRMEIGETVSLARQGGEATADGDVIGVRGADGRVTTAGAVLVAAGPWSPAIVDPTGHWCPIVRTWGVTVAISLSRPPGHVLEEAGVEAVNQGETPGAGRTVERRRDGARAAEPEGHFPSTFSLVSAAGLSVVGSTFLPHEPDAGSVGPLLLHRADRFVPGLHGVGVDELRACPRPQSLDGRPLVGRVPPYRNLFIAAGHGPWGISAGPATARMVTDLILGRPVAIPPPLDPARFF